MLQRFGSYVSRLVGYRSGLGGAVTQSGTKATAVTLDTICGQITTDNASLGAAAEVAFTVNNALVEATDVIAVCIASGGTTNAYTINVTAVAAGSFVICLGNVTAGTLTQVLVINFAVIKASAT